MPSHETSSSASFHYRRNASADYLGQLRTIGHDGGRVGSSLSQQVADELEIGGQTETDWVGPVRMTSPGGCGRTSSVQHSGPLRYPDLMMSSAGLPGNSCHFKSLQFVAPVPGVLADQGDADSW
jgi:hypothetical protein